MKLYQFEIPIPDYYGNEVFHQSMFFIGNKCPTKEEVILCAKVNHDRDSQYPEYTGDWMEVLKSIELAKEFPTCHGNLVHTNKFIEHPKFGKQPISVYCRQVYNLERMELAYNFLENKT